MKALVLNEFLKNILETFGQQINDEITIADTEQFKMLKQVNDSPNPVPISVSPQRDSFQILTTSQRIVPQHLLSGSSKSQLILGNYHRINRNFLKSHSY